LERDFRMCAKHSSIALLVITLLLPLLLSYPGHGATIGFKPAVKYAVGTDSRAVAVGDFNGDGKPDLAVVNAGNANPDVDPGYVSILLGDGDGTFRPADNLTAGKNPLSIAVGDFNGDKRPDLAVGNASDGGSVSILLGNGNGTFEPAKSVTLEGFVSSLAVGDFNGDLRPDLVVLRVPSSATMTVLLGNGDGTFAAGEDILTGISFGFNPVVLVADFNGDHQVDVVVSGQGRGGAILLGNGDGTLQPAVGLESQATSGAPISTGDFNRDGKLDLVMATEWFAGESLAFRVDVLLGNGDGTFQAAHILELNHSTFLVTLLAATGDLNGDMNPDLVVTQFSRQAGLGKQTVATFLGNGDGTFQPGGSFDTNAYPSWVSLADLNADQSPDLVTANPDDNTISVLLNSTGSEFSITVSAPSPATVSRGQSATSTVTLSHLNTFDNPVGLTCSVQPAQGAPTCSLEQDSVTFDANGNAAATLTIHTAAATALLVPQSPRRDSRPLQFVWLPAAGLCLMGASFGSNRSNRWKLTTCLLGGLLLSVVVLQAACGGASAGSHGPQSTTYTVAVTGTSGSTQHSTTTMITVQ
jgi:FG-GAP-like repeat